jgi:hypothetical protein
MKPLSCEGRAGVLIRVYAILSTIVLHVIRDGCVVNVVVGCATVGVIVLVVDLRPKFV